MIRKGNPEWPAAKRWLEEKITEAQDKLSAPMVPERVADSLRGEIVAYRKIIDHAEPAETQ